MFSAVRERLHINLSYLRRLPDGTPANIRIYLIFLETRIIDLHFAADSLCLIFIQIFLVGSEILFYFCKSDVLAVQAHPRSLILAPIESAYVTSY